MATKQQEHRVLVCTGLVAGCTALLALLGVLLSPSSSSSTVGQDGSGTGTGGLVGRGLRSLSVTNLPRISNLPLVVYYVDDDAFWAGRHWERNDDWSFPNRRRYDNDNDNNNDDDDYTFVYTPVHSEYIQPTNGGYGGKRGRAVSDIRFNKCPPIIDGYETSGWRYAPSRDYIKGVHTQIFPLMPKDYPLQGSKATILRRETMADSVVIPGDFQLHGDRDDDASYWLNGDGHGTGTGTGVSVRPIYPGDPGFWDELREVVEAQLARRRGDPPSSMNHWPAIWNDKITLDDVARAVQGEYPGLHQSKLIETFFKEGVEMYRDTSPFRSVVDFIGTDIRLAALNTWAFEAVAPINFLLKWHVGMPRPEEVAWMIYKGRFTPEADGVPEDLVALIQSMGNLDHAAAFTAYEDGSPMHPSFPAMHSAGSTCSFWMPAVCKLSPEQYCEALRVDYAVAYARTVAGVHYRMDNIAGLNIGQRIIREKLPAMLAENYGYDAVAVEAKLKALSFDWNDFDAGACTIAGVSAADFLARSEQARI
eukprot:jgi/Psemu1/54964/gm1.54964_g